MTFKCRLQKRRDTQRYTWFSKITHKNMVILKRYSCDKVIYRYYISINSCLWVPFYVLLRTLTSCGYPFAPFDIYYCPFAYFYVLLTPLCTFNYPFAVLLLSSVSVLSLFFFALIVLVILCVLFCL